ncbi:MAG: hypothetical protein ACYTG5_08230, partial [Planctomycetota bacterium]
RNGTWKPYFTLDGQELVLHNQPVPQEERPVSALRLALSRSYLAHAVFRRVAPQWWFLNRDKREHEQGPEVASALVRRLAQACADRGAGLLLVLLSDSDLDVTHLPAMRRFATEAGVELLDLTPLIAERASQAEDPVTVFRPKRHLSPDTNRRVAQRIAARVRERGW